jgi:hypothetical protein
MGPSNESFSGQVPLILHDFTGAFSLRYVFVDIEAPISLDSTIPVKART